MTPWNRLESELVRKRKTLSALADSLGVTKQALGHWKTRGIPAKYLRPAAEFVGHSLEWLEFDDAPETKPITSAQPLSDYAHDLAVLFDRLTTTENRADVALACRELIKTRTAESSSSAPNQSSQRRA